MKKKILSVVLALVLVLSMLTGISAAAAQDVKVVLFGQMLTFDVPPQLINGRTMVPLRKIFESLGATVGWDETTQTVTSTRGDTTVTLTIGVPSINVNGNAIALDTAPCVIDGRTLVPARAVSEAFGLKVDWDDVSWTVFITEPTPLPEPEPTPAPAPAPTVDSFTKLKNYIISNGEYDDGEYYVFYQPPVESDMNPLLILNYDPSENKISCMFSAEQGTGSDKVETSALVMIDPAATNGVLLNFEAMGMEFQIIGVYYTPNAMFTEVENTFPTYDLKATGRTLLHTSLETMDMLLQLSAGQSLSEFGVVYIPQ